MRVRRFLLLSTVSMINTKRCRTLQAVVFGYRPDADIGFVIEPHECDALATCTQSLLQNLPLKGSDI